MCAASSDGRSVARNQFTEAERTSWRDPLAAYFVRVTQTKIHAAELLLQLFGRNQKQ